jgi:stalled ribosome rescue protein Dom34
VSDLRRKQSHTRGYPIGVLIGFEEKQVAIWQIFSKMVKPFRTIRLGNDRKAIYNFHESIVDTLRPIIREGVRTVVVSAPPKTNHSKEFLKHVKIHHSWLTQENGPCSTTFGELIGAAGTFDQVSAIVKTQEFSNMVSDIRSQDANRIIDNLEKHINRLDATATVLYSLEEIEELVNGWSERSNPMPEYVVLTDKYLEDSREKNRVNRLLQISKNKNIMTRIVSAETEAGIRINQFGGLVCLTRTV